VTKNGKLDREARALLDLMDNALEAGRPKLSSLEVTEGRPAVDMMSENSEADPPDVGATEDGTLPGPLGPIKYRRYRPLGADQSALATLIYYHGGGFVIGTIETHDSTCRRLANKSRCQVIAIDYRLSPEHPFPAPTDDGIAAFCHIRDNAAAFDADPTRLAVGGDSAGGAIAAVICQAVRDAGETGPAFQMLIYPATDLSRESQSHKQFADGYFLTKELIDWFWKAYVPTGVDRTQLRLSPLLATDFKDLPSRLRTDCRLRPTARRRPRLRRAADRCRCEFDLRELSRHHPRLLLADKVPQSGAEGQRRSGGGDGGILRDLAMAWLRSSRLSRPIRNQWKIL
jgi:acetyl esterase